MNQGNNADDFLPKFFKVYIPDESGDDLELPISFNPYLPESLPKTITVRSIYGNVWTMGIRKCCGDIERFVMVDGWKRIVKDEDLKGGEFLEFEFDGSRLFNFCIYGDETCKKLRGSVQTKETEEKSHGENDFIVIDDDETDDSDNADYNCADDDDGDDYANDDDDGDDYVTDDDADNAAFDEDEDVGDDYANDDGDDNAADNHAAFDDDDNAGAEDDDDDERRYLDDPENPFFAITLNPNKKSQLHIPAQVIGDYALNFPKSITVVDPLADMHGKFEGEIKIQKNHMVYVKGISKIIRRNRVKTTDKMICEIKKRGTMVHTIRIHVIRG